MGGSVALVALARQRRLDVDAPEDHGRTLLIDGDTPEDRPGLRESVDGAIVESRGVEVRRVAHAQDCPETARVRRLGQLHDRDVHAPPRFVRVPAEPQGVVERRDPIAVVVELLHLLEHLLRVLGEGLGRRRPEVQPVVGPGLPLDAHRGRHDAGRLEGSVEAAVVDQVGLVTEAVQLSPSREHLHGSMGGQGVRPPRVLLTVAGDPHLDNRAHLILLKVPH